MTIKPIQSIFFFTILYFTVEMKQENAEKSIDLCSYFMMFLAVTANKNQHGKTFKKKKNLKRFPVTDHKYIVLTHWWSLSSEFRFLWAWIYRPWWEFCHQVEQRVGRVEGYDGSWPWPVSWQGLSGRFLAALHSGEVSKQPWFCPAVVKKENFCSYFSYMKKLSLYLHNGYCNNI